MFAYINLRVSLSSASCSRLAAAADSDHLQNEADASDETARGADDVGGRDVGKDIRIPSVGVAAVDRDTNDD